jgi:HAMP domain-containing protein
MTPIPQRALNRARDVRPLDRFRSIKIKLGVLVAVSVTFSGSFTAIGVSAGIKARYVVSVAVILSLIGTQILAHGMTSPLRSMADAVSRIARGDYSRRVKAATSRDEVGRLAAAFNLMAADLEAVDRQRKELIANVSHELRTPISALRAVLENVVDGVTEPDPPTMRLALEQAERLGRLVDTLLDLSRIDAGAVELDREDVDLQEFLGTVAREATVKLLARGTTGERPRTVVDVQPPDLTVSADRERLHQVAANLLALVLGPGLRLGRRGHRIRDGGRLFRRGHRDFRSRRGRRGVAARRGAPLHRGAPRGLRPGTRHPAGRAGPGVRPVRPRLAPGRRRRDRAGAGDRPVGGGPARRADLRRRAGRDRRGRRGRRGRRAERAGQARRTVPAAGAPRRGGGARGSGLGASCPGLRHPGRPALSRAPPGASRWVTASRHRSGGGTSLITTSTTRATLTLSVILVTLGHTASPDRGIFPGDWCDQRL